MPVDGGGTAPVIKFAAIPICTGGPKVAPVEFARTAAFALFAPPSTVTGAV